MLKNQLSQPQNSIILQICKLIHLFNLNIVHQSFLIILVYHFIAEGFFLPRIKNKSFRCDRREQTSKFQKHTLEPRRGSNGGAFDLRTAQLCAVYRRSSEFWVKNGQKVTQNNSKNRRLAV